MDMNTREIQVAIALSTDEFNREIENAARKNEELVNSLNNATESVAAPIGDLAISTENIQGAFDGLNISEMFPSIIEALRQMVEYFTKIKKH
ncbi:MAG: hypothetical protein FWE24_09165 [Defluviitaleaceae bacterium]|nr:hypothetical protein [Defluviitaleaceae bacterium]